MGWPEGPSREWRRQGVWASRAGRWPLRLELPRRGPNKPAQGDALGTRVPTTDRSPVRAKHPRTRDGLDFERHIGRQARLSFVPPLQGSNSVPYALGSQGVALGCDVVAPAGRRTAQHPNWRAGGSPAAAGSTPATQRPSPANTRTLNHACTVTQKTPNLNQAEGVTVGWVQPTGITHLAVGFTHPTNGSPVPARSIIPGRC